MSTHELSIRDLKELLSAQLPGLLHELVPGLKKSGSGYKGPNPARAGDSAGSFHVKAHGGFVEYDEGGQSSPSGSGDLMDLIALAHGQMPKTKDGRRFAAQWARQKLGLDTNRPEILHRARAQAHARRLEQTQKDVQRADYIRRRVAEICTSAQPVDPQDPDNPVVAYLSARGLPLRDLQSIGEVPRFAPKLQHWTAKRVFPAMVLPMRGPDGAIAGVHATFLQQDDDGIWGKARLGDGHNSKLMLGTAKGSIVPVSRGAGDYSLADIKAAGRSQTIVLAEGYETGLAVALALQSLEPQRVWACLNLGNIAHAPISHSAIDGVVVCLENDTKRAALEARERVLQALRDRHPNIMTMSPPAGWSDFAEGFEP